MALLTRLVRATSKNPLWYKTPSQDFLDDKLYKYRVSHRSKPVSSFCTFVRGNYVSLILFFLFVVASAIWPKVLIPRLIWHSQAVVPVAVVYEKSSIDGISDVGFVSKQIATNLTELNMNWLVSAEGDRVHMLGGDDIISIVSSVYVHGITHPGTNIMRQEQGTERVLSLRAQLQYNFGRNRTSFRSTVLAYKLPEDKPLFSNRKTLYLITPTFPSAKNGGKRAPYFERHLASLYLGMKESENIYKPHAFAKDAVQVIWIIAEDGPQLETSLIDALDCGGIPYIYFSYGPYHNYGNPQRNAALSVIRTLQEPPYSFRNGVAYFVDDDSLLTTTLWPFLTRVKGVSIWPSGNLGKDGWERPVFNYTTNRIETILGNGQYRKFPLDMGAFAFDTGLINVRFSKHQYFTRHGSGGESPFLAQLCDSWDDLNVMCTGCKLYFHNAKLRPHDVRLQCRKHP